MFDRTAVLGIALSGILLTIPATHCRAASPTDSNVRRVSFEDKQQVGSKDKDEDNDDKEHEGKKEKERKEGKEIEQAVPMNMIPQAVLDAVKKEIPSGTITEAELEAKKGKIMYSFDVKADQITYEVKITVDGKFYSKKVDEDDDDKDEKAKSPAADAKM